MARVQVVHDYDSSLYVQLDGNDEDASWDGPCTGCNWTPSEGGTRFNDLADAVKAAIVHLDHHR